MTYPVCASWHGKSSVTASTKSRQDLIAGFATYSNRSVILHYDTLAERIDVGGIGGIVFLRKKLNNVKGLQTIGPACWPAKGDLLSNAEVRKANKGKSHAVITLAEVGRQTVSEGRVEEWSLYFEDGGYRHLWIYVSEYRVRLGLLSGSNLTAPSITPIVKA